MEKWKRPRPCNCGGYWFPHRKAGGACLHNPDEPRRIIIAARIRGEDPLDALIDYALTFPKTPPLQKPPF